MEQIFFCQSLSFCGASKCSPGRENTSIVFYITFFFFPYFASFGLYVGNCIVLNSFRQFGIGLIISALNCHRILFGEVDSTEEVSLKLLVLLQMFELLAQC